MTIKEDNENRARIEAIAKSAMDLVSGVHREIECVLAREYKSKDERAFLNSIIAQSMIAVAVAQLKHRHTTINEILDMVNKAFNE